MQKVDGRKKGIRCWSGYGLFGMAYMILWGVLLSVSGADRAFGNVPAENTSFRLAAVPKPDRKHGRTDKVNSQSGRIAPTSFGGRRA